MSEPRRLILIVGQESARRRAIAGAVIEHGRSVVLCDGPPGCPLLRQESCVVVDEADAAIIIPPRTRSRETTVGVDLCVAAARRSVVALPSMDAAAVARALDDLLVEA